MIKWECNQGQTWSLYFPGIIQYSYLLLLCLLLNTAKPYTRSWQKELHQEKISLYKSNKIHDIYLSGKSNTPQINGMILHSWRAKFNKRFIMLMMTNSYFLYRSPCRTPLLLAFITRPCQPWTSYFVLKFICEPKFVFSVC